MVLFYIKFNHFDIQTNLYNHIGGIMVSMLTSSEVDRGFEPWSGQIKDYKIGICCFSAKHTGERANSGWLEIRIMCPSGATCGPFFQLASTIKIQLSVLV
jgi:hypothetical protein